VQALEIEEQSERSVDGKSPLCELWEGLNPLGFDEGTFMVLRGYIDESEKDADHFTLSCIISTGEQWNALETDWKGVLAAKNHELSDAGRKTITRYHATYCNSRWGEFKGWHRDGEIEFTASLLGIFNRYEFNQHSYSLSLKELASTIPEVKPNPKGFAYVILLSFILIDIAQETLSANKGSLINVFHDTCDYNAALREAYDEMIEGEESPIREYRHRFISMTPMIWRHCIALQPADLIAYENGKEFDRQFHATPKREKVRKSLGAIMASGRVGGSSARFSPLGMQQVKEIIDSMSEYTKEMLFLMARINKRHNKPRKGNKP